MNFIDRIRGTIGFNTHILFADKSVSDIMELLKQCETEVTCSSFIIHSMKYCTNMPGVDKIFLLAKAFNVEPTVFFISRDSKLLDRFLSLVIEKRPDILGILKSEGYKW